jgi:hypothetical protein
VPWAAWFGYRLFDALQQDDQDLASDAFWFLLIVPIGAPIVAMAVLWVIAGFRKREPASTISVDDDSDPPDPFFARSPGARRHRGGGHDWPGPSVVPRNPR